MSSQSGLHEYQGIVDQFNPGYPMLKRAGRHTPHVGAVEHEVDTTGIYCQVAAESVPGFAANMYQSFAANGYQHSARMTAA